MLNLLFIRFLSIFFKEKLLYEKELDKRNYSEEEYKLLTKYRKKFWHVNWRGIEHGAYNSRKEAVNARIFGRGDKLGTFILRRIIESILYKLRPWGWFSTSSIIYKENRIPNYQIDRKVFVYNGYITQSYTLYNPGSDVGNNGAIYFYDEDEKPQFFRIRHLTNLGKYVYEIRRSDEPLTTPMTRCYISLTWWQHLKFKKWTGQYRFTSLKITIAGIGGVTWQEILEIIKELL